MIDTLKDLGFRKPAWHKLLACLSVLGFAATVGAEPYLAIRTGFKCSQCHVNHIGGGERTEYGEVYSQYQLLMSQTQSLMQAGQSSYNPKVNDMITVGGNFREEEVVTQKYTYTDNVGSHVENSTNSFNVKESNFYVNVELIKNYFNMYLDENIGTGGAREMFGMLRNLPLDSYVKVGQMLLPYGLRLMDDDAFIRHMTNYTYSDPGLGAEIGLEPGPFSLTANFANNNRFSGVGSIVYRHFRLGGSYSGSWNNGAATINPVHYSYGPFAGLNFGKITMLGEMDFITGTLDLAGNPDQYAHQIASLAELDFLLMQGVNLKATYEYYDRNIDVPLADDGQNRWTFGVEPFVTRFLQLGLYYRFNNEIPQQTGTSPDQTNQDELIGRVHVFF